MCVWGVKEVCWGPDKDGGVGGGSVTWEPSLGSVVEGGGWRGALRGTGVGLIPIHPVLHSAGPGTISPARLPLRLRGDLWPHVYGCCPRPLYASILLLSAIFTPFDFPAGHCRAHTALLTDWKTQVLSFLYSSVTPRNLKTLSKHYLKWKWVRLRPLIYGFLI